MTGINARTMCAAAGCVRILLLWMALHALTEYSAMVLILAQAQLARAVYILEVLVQDYAMKLLILVLGELF